MDQLLKSAVSICTSMEAKPKRLYVACNCCIIQDFFDGTWEDSFLCMINLFTVAVVTTYQIVVELSVLFLDEMFTFPTGFSVEELESR
jgi:hypothetical protein